MFITGVHSPHSVQEGPDGHFYITNSISNQIGEFDPKGRTYVGYGVGANANYPHTLRIDRFGRVWFTILVSNQVGMFDTHSHKMRVFNLPADTDRPQIPLQFPYGIDINPVDDSVWYASLMANRIGRIDAHTFSVKSFTPPTVGPRRLRFAKDGTLWIPDFGGGKLIRLDTRLMTYKSYKIPTLAKGEVEAPYAVAVDPNTQEVWITPNMSDRMFRFLPKEERFIVYSLPARGTYLRDLIFTPEGLVCGANNPVPITVLEGGMGEILCLDPSGNTQFPRPANDTK
jgi:streptogramin lyase